jgi:uncharacterized protein YjbJ (UPF0337 family)
MDREHVKGVADKAKDAIKVTAGKATSDKEKFAKAQGSAHNDVADMRDVAQKAKEKSQ